jgi:hypothetical protein
MDGVRDRKLIKTVVVKPTDDDDDDDDDIGGNTNININNANKAWVEKVTFNPTTALGNAYFTVSVRLENDCVRVMEPGLPTNVYEIPTKDVQLTTDKDCNNVIQVSFNIIEQYERISLYEIFTRVCDMTRHKYAVLPPPILKPPGVIDVRYPSPDVEERSYFDYSSSALPFISIEAGYFGTIDVIAHEYGHYMMWHLHGGTFPPDSGGKHSVCSPSSRTPQVAWTEGYATAYAMILLHENDAENVMFMSVGTVKSFEIAVERYSCNPSDGSPTSTDINKDEGRVFAALWDLYDLHNDGSSAIAFGNPTGRDNNHDYVIDSHRLLINPLITARPTTIEAYWAALSPLLSNDELVQAKSVMCYNTYSTLC